MNKQLIIQDNIFMSNMWLTVHFLGLQKRELAFGWGNQRRFYDLLGTWRKERIWRKLHLRDVSLVTTTQNSCLSKDCQVGLRFRKNCKQRIRNIYWASIVLGTVGETGVTKIIVSASEDLKYYWGREICKSVGVKHISIFLVLIVI